MEKGNQTYAGKCKCKYFKVESEFLRKQDKICIIKDWQNVL